jgi:hypothetical protein
MCIAKSSYLFYISDSFEPFSAIHSSIQEENNQSRIITNSPPGKSYKKEHPLSTPYAG